MRPMGLKAILLPMQLKALVDLINSQAEQQMHSKTPFQHSICLHPSSSQVTVASTSPELSWEKLAAEALYQPAAVARLCNVSLRTLQRHFRKRYGTTVSTWLWRLRLAEAYRLIRSGESVKGAAFTLGFKQLSHFSRAFKEAHGIAPRFLAAENPPPFYRLLSSELHLPPQSKFLRECT